MNDTCRCGHTGRGPHPSHGKGHECGKPATQRFYHPRLVSLSGMQMKVGVVDTWACDNCWREFQKLMKEQASL